MQEMNLIKITPTGNANDMLALYLNEKNTIHDFEIVEIIDALKAGKTEGDTEFGIWQRTV